MSRSSVTAYLVMKDAAKAMEFYKEVFSAKEIMCLKMGDRIGHAQLDIGGTIIMLADEFPQMPAKKNPLTLGATTVSLYLRVANVDEVFGKAISAGAIENHPVSDMFYGDRTGTLTDPFGHVWSIATQIKEVPVEEMQAFMAKML